MRQEERLRLTSERLVCLVWRCSNIEIVTSRRILEHCIYRALIGIRNTARNANIRAEAYDRLQGRWDPQVHAVLISHVA